MVHRVLLESSLKFWTVYVQGTLIYCHGYFLTLTGFQLWFGESCKYFPPASTLCNIQPAWSQSLSDTRIWLAASSHSSWKKKGHKGNLNSGSLHLYLGPYWQLTPKLSTTTRKSWEVACLTDLLKNSRWQADGNLHKLGRPVQINVSLIGNIKELAAAFRRQLMMNDVNQIGLRICHLTHIAWIPDTRKHTLDLRASTTFWNFGMVRAHRCWPVRHYIYMDDCWWWDVERTWCVNGQRQLIICAGAIDRDGMGPNYT